MPLPFNDEVKRKLLVNRGLNPEQWDIDESTLAPTPKTQYPIGQSGDAQPSTSPDSAALEINKQLVSKGNQTTALEAGGRAALASAIPTAAGFWGGVGAGALTGAVTANPIGIGIGGLLGGLGSAYGASKIQDQFLPESFKAKLAQGEQEHPLASAAGGFVPAAATMNIPQSLRNVKSLVGKIPAMIAGGKLAEPELKAFQNIAINAGTAGGQDVYSQLQNQDQPFSPAQLALNVGLGGILHEPNAIGRNVFRFHPTGMEGFNPDVGANLVGKPQVSETQQQTTIAPDQAKAIQDRIDALREQQLVSKKANSLRTTAMPTAEALKLDAEGAAIVPKGHFAVAPEPVDIPTFEGEGGLTAEVQRQAQEKQDLVTQLREHKIQMDETKATLAEQQRKLEEGIASLRQGGETTPTVETTTPPLKTPQQILEQKPTAEQLAAAQQKPPVAETLSSNKLTVTQHKQLSDLGYSRELRNKITPDRAKEIIDAKLTPDKFSSESSLTDAEKEQLLLRNRPDFKTKQEAELRKRGITPQYPEILTDAAGRPVLGKADIATREAQLGPTAALDTAPHEGGHFSFHDLAESGSKSDRDLHAKAMEVAPKLPEIPNGLEQKMKDEGYSPKDIMEERFVYHLGTEGAKRVRTELYGTKREKVMGFLNQAKSHLMTKLGAASPADVINHMDARYKYDAPYGTRGVEGRGRIEGTPLANAKYQEPGKELGPDARVTVNQPMDVGNGQKTPAYVQVDMADNSRSTNPETLRKEGYTNIPSSAEILASHAQGQYKLGDVNAKLATTNKPKFSSESGLNKDEGVPSRENIADYNEKKYLPKYETAPNIKEYPTEQESIGRHKVEKGISDKLGEASFQAAKEAQKAQEKHGFEDTHNVDVLISQVNGRIRDEFKKQDIQKKSLDNDISKNLAENIVTGDKESIDEVRKNLGDEFTDELLNHVHQSVSKINESSSENRRTAKESFNKANTKASELEAFTRPDVERHSSQSSIKPEQRKSFVKSPVARKVNYEESTGQDLTRIGNRKGEIATPFGDIKSFYRQNSRFPTDQELTDMGYTGKYRKEYDQSIAAKLAQSPDPQKLQIEAANLAIEGKHEQALAKDREGITRALENNLWAREGFSKIKVVDEPTSGGESVGGLYNPNTNEATAMPERLDIASHEIFHKEFENLWDRFPFEDLINDAVKKNPTFKDDLSAAAKLLKERAPNLYYNHTDNAIAFSHGGSTKSGLHVLDETLAHGISTPSMFPIAEKLSDAVFGKQFTNILREMRPRDYRGITRPDTYYPGYDKLSRQYYSTESSVLNSTPEQRKAYTETKPDIVLHLIGSAIDKVRNMGSATANYVSDKLEKHALLRSIYEGRYANVPENMIASAKSGERANVDQYGREMQAYGKSDITLTPNEKALYDGIREHLIKIADESTIREISKDPNYWPAMLSREVAGKWRDNPNSPESEKFKQQWLAWADKENPQGVGGENEKILRDYMDAIGNRRSSSLYFGALRKAEGIGLPESLQDNNLLSRFSRYGKRVARDLAFNQTLETDPVVRYAMRIKDPAGNIQTEQPDISPGQKAEDLSGTALQNVEKYLYNDFSDVHAPKVRAAQRLVSSALLGTATGVRNVAQIPVLTLPYTRLADFPSYFKALGNFKQAWKDSFEYNSRRRTLNDIEYGSAASPDTIANQMNNVADIMRKYSGRDMFEQAERAYEHGLGAELARANLGRAYNGDIRAKSWLNKFGAAVDGGVEQYFNKPLTEVPQDALNRIAKSFVDRVSGSYDERGLPAGAMEGSLAPFFALSRWNIEKANVIYKDVIKPMRETGDFTPFLTYTLGSLLTGAAIRSINEVLSHKEAQDASLTEATEAGSIQHQAGAVVSMMQLSSYGGIMSDVMQAASKLSQGQIPQGLSFPLADFVGHTLGKNLADAAGAINNGEDKLQVGLNLVENIVRNTVQGARLMANNTWLKDDVERQNKFRDLRVWQELTGQRVPSNDFGQGNAYVDEGAKKFKQTQDLGEAAQMLPSLLSRAIEKSNGDPFELKRELSSIKNNNYQTMPNPKNMPLAFARYLGYLQKTKGTDEASSRLMDYIRQNAVNQAKGSMVPSI